MKNWEKVARPIIEEIKQLKPIADKENEENKRLLDTMHSLHCKEYEELISIKNKLKDASLPDEIAILKTKIAELENNPDVQKYLQAIKDWNSLNTPNLYRVWDLERELDSKVNKWARNLSKSNSEWQEIAAMYQEIGRSSDHLAFWSSCSEQDDASGYGNHVAE